MAKIQDVNQLVTKDELKILAEVSKDPFLFSTFCYVIHPVRGKVQFKLYPYQKAVLYQFILERFNIILKFRQAGITELISLYCLWLTMYHPNKKVNIISIKDTTAKKVLKKIKFMYKNLPWYLQTPIINGRAGEFGSACITGDTRLITESGNLLTIGSISPQEKGYFDVSQLGIRVLTHTGNYKRVLNTFNKGVLKTYELSDDFGNTIKCTPKHKMLTTQGWETVENILRDNLTVIVEDTNYYRPESLPVTTPPSKEVIKPTKYPGYFVSNLGRVFTSKRKVGKGKGRKYISLNNPLRELKTRKASHERIKLRLGNGDTIHTGVHRLVAETFIGPIPEGYIVDHINCNPFDNYVTNLQIITQSENTKRAVRYSTLGSQGRKNGLYDIDTIGKVKEKYQEYGNYYGVAKRIKAELNTPFDHKRVSQICRGIAYNWVKITKLHHISTFKAPIYDLEVEHDHSYVTDSGFINHNSMIEFSNGSFIESIPTSSEAGRSESLSLLVIDEAAIVRWASQIWAAAFPTLSCSIGSTPVFLRSYKEIKRGYPKPITEIIKIRDICSNREGVLDISNLNYYTLTHQGNWKKILWTQNKGRLETWVVKDNRGKIGGYTPKHRLFTTQGWKTLEEVIEQDLNVVQVDTKANTIKKPKSTKPPTEEVLKPLEEFPGYFVSNLGKVYNASSRRGFYEMNPRANKDGYLRVGLRKPGVKREHGSRLNQMKGKTFQRSLHTMVAEAFLGPCPEGYQVDHINCVRSDNHINNLRYIPISENIARSFEYNLNATLSGIQGDKLPDLIKRGRILEMAEEGFSYREIAHELYPGYTQAHKFVKRILNERGSRVYISKLTLVKKTTRKIYDIHVEDDNSYISANNYVNHNTGGSAIVNSTPYGTGNFYHSTWVDSIVGGNVFNPIRLYWQMHPERDENWYKEMATALGPKRTAQEIDGDFLTSGNQVFDLRDIKAIEDCLSDYPVIRTRFNGQYRQFLEPDPNQEYFIGADVATGRASDYSAFTCMNKSGEEQAIYKGRMPVDKYSKFLGDTGTMYNYATIAPESNDIGLAVTSFLQTEGYPKLYYYQKMVKKKGKSRPEVDKSPGWLTTSKNRSVIIEGLEADLREENIIVKDPFFVQEAYTFIYDGLGRPVAMGKHRNNSQGDVELETEVYADDSILAKSITNHIRKGKTNVIVAPK